MMMIPISPNMRGPNFSHFAREARMILMKFSWTGSKANQNSIHGRVQDAQEENVGEYEADSRANAVYLRLYKEGMRCKIWYVSWKRAFDCGRRLWWTQHCQHHRHFLTYTKDVRIGLWNVVNSYPSTSSTSTPKVPVDPAIPTQTISSTRWTR